MIRTELSRDRLTARAEFDLRQNAAEGVCSGFAPHLPEGLFRGVITTDEEGLDPKPGTDGRLRVEYDPVLEPA